MRENISQSYNGGVQTRADFRCWYGQFPGQILQQYEKEKLDQILPNLFGYHLLQVGNYWSETLLESSRIPHKVVIDADLSCQGRVSRLAAYPDFLPIQTDSVDVVLMPHTLELDPDPHQVLREAERVLIPEGHLILLGFNPISWWGVWRILRAWGKQAPWSINFFGQTRIKDWLALMGFEIVKIEKYFYRPPISHEKLISRLNFMETIGNRYLNVGAGAYVLLAKKRIARLTPIKPKWRRRLLGTEIRPISEGIEGNG